MTRKQGWKIMGCVYALTVILTGLTFGMQPVMGPSAGSFGGVAIAGALISLMGTPEVRNLSATPSYDLRSWAQGKYPELR